MSTREAEQIVPITARIRRSAAKNDRIWCLFSSINSVLSLFTQPASVNASFRRKMALVRPDNRACVFRGNECSLLSPARARG